MRDNRSQFFKRSIAFAIAAILAVGGIIGVSAKSFDDVEANGTYTEQIDILSDIGVIKGTSDNEFSPNKDVTREQMALFLFRLMLNKPDGGKVNTSPFTDLYDETYHGAISWAAGSGYILGTSDNTFEPTGGITLQDAMTMIVRALGQSSPQMNAGYPWTYIDAAIKLGLDKGLENVAYSETLTREEVAVILYNALTAEYLVPKTLANGAIIYESTTIIEKVFGYEMDTAVITATNDFALTGNTVIKNGCVILTYTDDSGNLKTIAANFDELGLEGNPNDWLGREVKLIYTAEKASSTVNVLSSIPTGKSETFNKINVAKDNEYIEINGTKYNVVEEYSDDIATNNNELLVFAYENSGKLTQITNNEELNDRLGFYEVELIYNSTNNETASIAILKNFKFGNLDISANGKINIAENKTEAELTGGFTNTAEAVNGDYVLYYYNSQVKCLEIVSVPDVIIGTVNRLTDTTVKIGDTVYNLGNEKAGITAESVKEMLSIGKSAVAVVYDGAVLAIMNGQTASVASQYLLVETNPAPIYSNGTFRYVLRANIDGKSQDIFVSDNTASAGNVYRYTVTGDTYNLVGYRKSGSTIVSGTNEFVQNGNNIHEIAAVIESSTDSTITYNDSHYEFAKSSSTAETSEAAWTDYKFVTDKDTVILVGGDNGVQYKKGYYDAEITINSSAKVIAVMNNEPGDIETLRFLYISDGELSEYDSSAQHVKILSFNGYVYENGISFAEYTVMNFSTGVVETRISSVSGLEIGKTYRTDANGNIVNSEADDTVSGLVTGVTSSTITVGGEIYKLANDVKVLFVDSNNEVKEKKLSDVYMSNVEFIVQGDVVKTIQFVSDPSFTPIVVVDNRRIRLVPNFQVSEITGEAVALTKLTINGIEAETSTFTVSTNDGTNSIVFVLASGKEFVTGTYNLTFTIGSRTFTHSVEVEVPTVIAE